MKSSCRQVSEWVWFCSSYTLFTQIGNGFFFWPMHCCLLTPWSRTSSLLFNLWDWFPIWEKFAPRQCLAMFGDIFDYRNWRRGITGIYRVDSRNTAKCSAIHRAALHNKELSCLKYQIVLRLRNPGLRDVKEIASLFIMSLWLSGKKKKSQNFIAIRIGRIFFFLALILTSFIVLRKVRCDAFIRECDGFLINFFHLSNH